MESNQQTRLEIKTSADGKPLEFVIESSDPVFYWQVYYAEQERIADDMRWQNDPLEIKQHLEVIWDDILSNASNLFYLLGNVCNKLGDICHDACDRLYPYD